MTTPIRDAEALLRAAIWQQAAPGLVAAGHVDAAGAARLYWQVAPDNTPRPYVVFFCQADVLAVQHLGRLGATVPITLRATASDPDVALAALNAAAAGLGTTTIDDHTIRATYTRSPSIPFTGTCWQAAHTYQLSISTEDAP